ncbi:hypothetical protein [uncultured Phascolarctobacterium sp.]|jgi:drug/metabolite transporter (DMT)-like permease|uniref:hypothetical protein n=1 Tax=uncultured Phascolarctobacterium sp. TaxID=512296 RepID=UPI0025FDCBD0|nr:hypothetical protein [uncultured Phascolarctobacterium sp.]
MFEWVPYQCWLFISITGSLSAFYVCLFEKKYSSTVRIAFFISGLALPFLALKESIKNRLIEPIFPEHIISYGSWVSLILLLLSFILLFSDIYFSAKKNKDEKTIISIKKFVRKILITITIGVLVFFLMYFYIMIR